MLKLKFDLTTASGLTGVDVASLKFWTREGVLHASKRARGRVGHPGWHLSLKGLLQARLANQLRSRGVSFQQVKHVVPLARLDAKVPPVFSVRAGGDNEEIYVVVGSTEDAAALSSFLEAPVELFDVPLHRKELEESA